MIEKGKRYTVDNERNSWVDIWRFIFSIIIVLVHYGTCPGGYLGVEFFFLLSGYYLARTVEFDLENNEKKDAIDNTWAYTKKRFFKFFPYMATGYTVGFVIRHIDNTPRGGGIIKDFALSLGEVSMVAMSGLDNKPHYTSGWYLSALLIASFILYYIYFKNKKFFVNMILPCLVLWGLGYSYQNYGGFEDGYLWNGLFFSGMLRALIELSMGIYAYVLTVKLKEIRKANKILMEAVGTIGFLLVIGTGFFFKSAWLDYLFLMVLFIGIVAINIREHPCRVYGKKGKSLSAFLAELSLPLFLCHGSLIIVLSDKLPVKGGSICIIFLSMLLAMIELWIVKKGVWLLKRQFMKNH